MNAVFPRYLDTVGELVSANPHRRFVLRPHPFENQSVYRERFAASPNLIVDGSGDILNAIIHADCTLHLNCGSRGETVLLGRTDIHGVSELRNHEASLSAAFNYQLPSDRFRRSQSTHQRCNGASESACDASCGNHPYHSLVQRPRWAGVTTRSGWYPPGSSSAWWGSCENIVPLSLGRKQTQTLVSSSDTGTRQQSARITCGIEFAKQRNSGALVKIL